MVGVPTSRGCATCLKRAVKCDEVRPTCSQCRRGGRTCPGYTRAMLFIDEGPKMQRKRKTAAAVALRQREPVVKDQKKSVTPMLKAPTPVALEQFQLLSVCISSMFPLVPTRSSYLGTWLWHIPPRIGQSKALDYAALSVALMFHSRKDPLLRYQAQEAYGVALRSLAAAVADPQATVDADTLGATMLLTYYETLSNIEYAWVRHAGGAGRLLQVRGAKSCYNSPFEYFMFLACRGSLIYEALLLGKPSFLEAPEWQALPPDVIEYPFMPKPAELSHRFFTLAANLPGVLHRAKTSGCNRLKAHTEASALRSGFMNWYRDFTEYEDGLRRPVLIPAPEGFPEGPFNDVFLYYDTASATLIMTHYAYLILLDEQIAQNKIPDDADNKHDSFIDENLELARWIGMSVYYCAYLAGHCGTTALKMVLPIARAVLPSDHHEWMSQWISLEDEKAALNDAPVSAG